MEVDGVEPAPSGDAPSGLDLSSKHLSHLADATESPGSSAPNSPRIAPDDVLPGGIERPKSDKLARLEAKVAKDPYNEVAWASLVAEAVLHTESYTQSVFERMVTTFPTSVRGHS